MMQNTGHKLRITVVAASLVAAFIVAILPVNAANAYTLNAEDFNPGTLISDAQFFDEDALTEAQIQSFLNAKIGNCTNSLCLNVYRQDTFTREASVIDTNSNAPLCRRYQGATNESAARIIYKVQQACGISAKVILVTLQKEQGLVTSTAPTLGKLKIAMGYGCPDTAPCDSQYFGFYNQVYKASSQLKRYTNPASSFYSKFPVGAVSRVAFHPNSYSSPAVCGFKNVTISNLATHALYIYTPYTPNATSLSNLWSTGDSCSSYGNRNFWRNYNSWFNLRSELKHRVSQLPAATRSALGSIVSESSCIDTENTCLIAYQTGVASLSLLGSLSVVFGKIGIEYQQSGGISGPLGGVVGEQEAITTADLGRGSRQRFENGYIYESPSGNIVTIMNPLHATYLQNVGVTGALGWPKSEVRCVASNCEMLFDRGLIVNAVSGRTDVLLGPTAMTYAAQGGITSVWGLPLSGYQSLSPAGLETGSRVQFTKGFAYNVRTTVQFVPNALQQALNSNGGLDVVGWPVAASRSSGNSIFQEFSKIYVVGDAGNASSFLIDKSAINLWVSQGGRPGILGYPTAGSVSLSGPSSTFGRITGFSNGTVIEGVAGAFFSPRVLYQKLEAAGGVGGRYGWPIANAIKTSTGWSQRFQGGTISASDVTARPTIRLGSRGTHVVYLQRKLKITTDGIFGVKTRAAVLAFQRAKGLVADGIVGPRTWAALG